LLSATGSIIKEPPMRRLALAGLVAMVAVTAGCGGENTRPKFKEALQTWFRLQNREAAAAKEAGAPIVHEYRDERIPADTEQGMPVAKRRHMDPNDARGDEAISGAFSAVVGYTLVTLERKTATVTVPQEAVSEGMKPEQITTASKAMAVYKPVQYAQGRRLFVFKGGELSARPVPYEVPMTQQEQQKVILGPRTEKEAAAPAK
jgi:hypothetical protein